ncbi:MAG TPA: MFS transporter [Ktedonobacteraceae bacterium]|nr:MFS transporter [Ktedonobacteraceae bacterium]
MARFAVPGTIFNARTFVSLREHHNYRLYFSGQFLSQIGTWLQSAAMAWLVLELTHSAFAVGLLTFWQFGPYLLLGLFGGAISDRFDHRQMLIATQIALAICSGVMAVLTLLHIVTVWEAYVVAALRGLVLILNNPSRQAFIFQMVGRGELPNTIALNSSVANATRIIGPGVGGLLIAAFGVGICFSIDAISYVAVIIALLLMHVDELLPIERHGRPPVLKSIGEGLGYVWRTPTVWLALLMFLFICTASINFTVLLPLVASNTLRDGAQVYGLLTACFGAGALIGALLSASIGRASWRLLLISAAGFGLGEVILAPQRSVVGAILLLILTGVFYTLYTSNTNALVQLATPPYLQGRVAGLYSYIFSGSNSFGSLLAGALAERGGTQLAFLVAGATALACAVLGLLVRWRGPRDRAPVEGTITAPH